MPDYQRNMQEALRIVRLYAESLRLRGWLEPANGADRTIRELEDMLARRRPLPSNWPK